MPGPRYVDRPNFGAGLNTTERDSRLIPAALRNVENFRLPDQRLQRRQGFLPHNTDRVTGQCLTKQQSTEVGFRATENESQFGEYWRTPNSYGLIRHNLNFQPRTDIDWTIEFQLRMGEKEILLQSGVKSVRLSLDLYSDGEEGTLRIPLRVGSGVMLLDQTVLASDVDIKFGGVIHNVRRAQGQSAPNQDCFGTTAICIYATEGAIVAEASMFNTALKYYSLDVADTRLASVSPTWTEGNTYHVALTYVASTRTTTLRAKGTDGTFTDSSIITDGFEFPGQNSDDINQLSRIINRDITLLNEHTTRYGMSSTCKMSASVSACSKYNEYDGAHIITGLTTEPPAHIDHLSPPKGTGMCELRWWHEARSTVDLDANALKELADPLPDSLKGYWQLNDGGGMLFEKKSETHGTVHNNLPQWMVDSALLHGTGINIADNQFLNLLTFKDDENYIRDLQVELLNLTLNDVLPNTTTTPTVVPGKAQNDLTVSIQVRTPYSWQQELSTLGTEGVPDPARNLTFFNETREKPHDLVSGQPLVYALTDGNDRPMGTWEGDLTEEVYHPAYDMTLWSWEGRSTKTDEDNVQDVENKPLYRVLINPAGKVVFEFFGDGQTTTDNINWTQTPFYHRIVSTTTLSVDTVYDITVRKKTLYEDVSGFVVSKGWRMEIFINGVKDATVYDRIMFFSGITTAFGGFNQRPMGWPQPHRADYTISVGASYTTDHLDKSYRTPRIVSGGPTWTIDEGDLVTQRKNGSMQDHPGFFRLGYFRIWKTALDDNEIAEKFDTSIATESDSNALILNFEVERVSGTLLQSRTRFPVALQLDYKDHNQPEPWQFAAQTFYRDPFYWGLADCLGYGRRPQTFEAAENDNPFQLVGFHSRTLEQAFGLLAISKDVIMYDDNFTGDLNDNVARVTYGLMSEFSPGSFWDHTNIGERTFVSSPGGIIKVFTGDSVYVAGFGQFRGGRVRVKSFNSVTPPGAIIADTFYKVVVTYFSDEWNIEHIGFEEVVKVGSSDDSILVENIPPHPDRRITSIRIYRTLATDGTSEDTARNGTAFLTAEGALVNHGISSHLLFSNDEDLFASPLIIDVTDVPQGSFVSSWDGRLWVAGNRLFPDTIFFSDAGNPERFDSITNQLVLEESKGDAINGMIAIFGALFIFKPKSVWRVDRVGGGFQTTRVANIGANSNESIQVISLPDSGRTAIVFWSDVGPMLFDGVNMQNFGYQIEKREGNTRPYEWMELLPVRTLHDRERRELVFFYVPTGGTRYDEAMVYNYRFKTWTRQTKLPGGVGASSAEAQQISLAGFLDGPIPTFLAQLTRAYFGGSNGIIHRWGESELDGMDSETVTDNITTVTAFTATTVTVSSLPSGLTSELLKGLFISFVKPDGSNFRSGVIESFDAATDIVTLSTTYIDERASLYTVAINDIVLFGQPPAWLQLPWDNMDSNYETTLLELLTWHDGIFFYRFGRDWGAVPADKWIELTDTESTRKLSKPNITADSTKLELYSLQLKAQMNQLAYRVNDKVAPARTSQQ